MKNLNRPLQALYTEEEAAATLGITIARLHELLDKYIFTGENRRPAAIEFNSSDLVLLRFWNHASKTSASGRRVLQMPKRR